MLESISDTPDHVDWAAYGGVKGLTTDAIAILRVPPPGVTSLTDRSTPQWRVLLGAMWHRTHPRYLLVPHDGHYESPPSTLMDYTTD